MSLVVEIANRPRRQDPDGPFISGYSKSLWALYQAGAHLYVHQPEDDWKTFLLTKEGLYVPLFPDRGDSLPLVGLGAWLAFEEWGSPVPPTEAAPYRQGGVVLRIDKARLTRSRAEWAEVQATYEHRQTHPRPWCPNVEVLSPTAKALLRTLRAKALYPFEELLDAFKELDDQGLLALGKDGLFELQPWAGGLEIPVGPRVVLKHVY